MRARFFHGRHKAERHLKLCCQIVRTKRKVRFTAKKDAGVGFASWSEPVAMHGQDLASLKHFVQQVDMVQICSN